MGRDAQDQAKQTFKAQQTASAKYGANADAAYSQLMPQYTNMALNPQGLSPTDRAALSTTSQQSTGGSTAGAVTQGNLQGARTGNAGAYQASLSDAVRQGVKQNSNNALAADTLNIGLKQQQQQQGLAGENGLYSSNLGAATGELNAQNQSTQALTDAGKSGWFQNMTGLISAVGTAATGAANAKTAFAGCWVAAELYGGWYAPKTIEIRAFLITRTSLAGMAFRWFYQTFGLKWAEAIKKHVTLRKVTKTIFDRIHARAVNCG